MMERESYHPTTLHTTVFRVPRDRPWPFSCSCGPVGVGMVSARGTLPTCTRQLRPRQL